VKKDSRFIGFFSYGQRKIQQKRTHENLNKQKNIFFSTKVFDDTVFTSQGNSNTE